MNRNGARVELDCEDSVCLNRIVQSGLVVVMKELLFRCGIRLEISQEVLEIGPLEAEHVVGGGDGAQGAKCGEGDGIVFIACAVVAIAAEGAVLTRLTSSSACTSCKTSA